MNAGELIRSGKLSDAIQVLTAQLRDHPADTRSRTFLFELLCFAGQYERAEKHLNVLAQSSQDAEMGGLLYRSALSAERQRQVLLESQEHSNQDNQISNPDNDKPPRSGILNGKPFRSMEDLDPRIGPRLEMFVAGEYVWLPFEHIGSIRMQAPKYLRDTLWATANVRTSSSFKGQDFGEVLVPVVSPFSWRHESDEIKLGRSTDWKQEGNALLPFGQKLLLVDDEEAIPYLEIREIDFDEISADESQPLPTVA